MQCTIEWNGMDLATWSGYFNPLRRSTLLQCYDYARAVAPIYGQRPRWGLIRIDGKEAGIVQMMEAKFMGLHAFTIDRGPLWFVGFGGVAHIRIVFDELNRQFPRRFGRRRRVIPEITESPTVAGLLKQAGFEKTGPQYTTAWLDLTQSEEDLRRNLKGNWRNYLKKVEGGPLQIVWDDPAGYLPWLVQTYQADQIMRGYPGPKPRIMTALGKTFAAKDQLVIGRALLDNRAVAAILILCHGCSATYQIGWSDEEGRKHGGHYRLLWSVLEQLKAKNITDLDLGGINDDSATGVSAFKDGMGGTRVTLTGLYS
jgi:hypothetical protein